MRRVIASRSMKFGAEHLRQPALDRSPPEIHLEQPVLRLDEALREEEIVLLLARRCAARPSGRARREPARSGRRRSSVPDTCGASGTPPPAAVRRPHAAETLRARETQRKRGHRDTETQRRGGASTGVAERRAWPDSTDARTTSRVQSFVHRVDPAAPVGLRCRPTRRHHAALRCFHSLETLRVA